MLFSFNLEIVALATNKKWEKAINKMSSEVEKCSLPLQSR